MKKIFILFAIVFLLSGCTVDYEIKVGYESLNEKTTLIGDSTSVSQVDKLMTTYSRVLYFEGYNPYLEEPIRNHTYYEKERINNGQGIIVSHSFDYLTYSYSAMAINCFNNYSFAIGEESFYYLEASQFICFDKYPELSTVNIKIYVNSMVINSNADSQINGVHTWSITRDNANTTNIILTFNEPTIDESAIESQIIEYNSSIDNPSSSNNNDPTSSNNPNDPTSSSSSDDPTSNDNSSSDFTSSSKDINSNDGPSEKETDGDEEQSNSIITIIVIVSLVFIIGIISYAFIRNQQYKKF